MSMRDFLARHPVPPIVAPPTVAPANPKSPPIDKLLDWIVNYWARPTITARDIHIYGPNCTRDRKTTLTLAETLVARGWLRPLKTRQRNMRKWQINRGGQL